MNFKKHNQYLKYQVVLFLIQIYKKKDLNRFVNNLNINFRKNKPT